MRTLSLMTCRRSRRHRDGDGQPAKASYDLIRWENTGFCQIRDRSIPDAPYWGDFTTVAGDMLSFEQALSEKDDLISDGTCAY